MPSPVRPRCGTNNYHRYEDTEAMRIISHQYSDNKFLRLTAIPGLQVLPVAAVLASLSKHAANQHEVASAAGRGC